MFRSILVIYRELLKNNKTYIKKDEILNTLKFIHKITADILNFVVEGGEFILRCYNKFYYTRPCI